MTAPLAIEGLRFGFGGAALFREYDLTLEPGRHTLLLGTSGSGKTTLIQLICGLRTPSAGRIAIGDETMTGLSATRRDDLRRRKIGLIFQTLRLVSALDVRANLLLAQRLAGSVRDTARIDALLDAVGIAHRAVARPRDLSRGEAQRAAIARALVTSPTLVVADEPTSALDDESTERVARLLIETAEANGSTLLIATHDTRLRAFVSAVTLL